MVTLTKTPSARLLQEEAYEAFYSHGMSVAEIAEQAEVPILTIRDRIAKERTRRGFTAREAIVDAEMRKRPELCNDLAAELLLSIPDEDLEPIEP